MSLVSIPSVEDKRGLSADCFSILEALLKHSGREFGFGERVLAELTPWLDQEQRGRALEKIEQSGLIQRSELLDGTTRTFVIFDLLDVERTERLIRELYTLAPPGQRSRLSGLAELAA